MRAAPTQSITDAAEGERKTVTALFADIKGSTELEQDLDPEEARAIIDPALKLMIHAARRYDGYVVQSTGDGIFALFGAPDAHEDHPQRALYAALRIQEELKRYAAKLREQGQLPIEARIGVNTGEVVVRSIATGSGHSEYTPIGHTTNLAARMQALAPTGSITATDAIRKLTEGYFTFKALGPTRIKGLSEPVNVYEVTGLGPLRTRLQRAAGRGLTKFVGREREMEALRHAAELARGGRGQIVAVVAEPGVGKSRLFFEFKAKHQSGWMVLEAVSVSHGKATVHRPVVDMLRSYFGIEDGDAARKRREKVAGRLAILDPALEDTRPFLFALLGIVEGDDLLAQMDARIRRQRTLDAIKRILLRESLNHPLMVVFEDLHWTDEETQAFLNLLADSIGTAKVLLLVNYRPEYAHSWGSKTYYTQLRLDPLGGESADEMLSALLGDDESLVPLKRLIIEKTEGNPLFMEEIYQALIEEGALVRDGAAVKLTKAPNQLKIPPTVQDILASRIDHLRANEKELLQTLAVIGRGFPLALARTVIGKTDDELNRLLNGLQRGEFIYEQPAAGDVEYTFKHALTQEVAYRSLLVERRKALHERIGAAIEETYASRLDDHVNDLARHYSRSGNAQKATEYLERAGRRATIRGAFKEAEVHFQEAIALLHTTPETAVRMEREFNLQLALVGLLSNTRGFTSNETEFALRRLKELSEKIGNSDQLILTLGAAWAPLLGRGELTAAQRIADQMLEIAEQTGSRPHLTLAQLFVAQTHLWRGNLKQAMQHFEALLASYRQSDFSGWPVDPKANALSFMGVLWWHLGMADRAGASIREAISWAEQIGNPAQLAEALGCASHLHIDLLDPEKVQEYADRQLALAREVGIPAELELSSAFRGWAIAQQGRTGEGCAMIRSALDSTLARGTSLNVPQFLGLLSSAQARGGQLEGALTTIEKALSSIGEEEVSVLDALWQRGRIYLQHGDEAEAQRDFRATITAASRMGSKAYQLRATTSLARLLAKQGHRREEARAILADIYGWFTEGFDTADLKDAKALLDELST